MNHHRLWDEIGAFKNIGCDRQALNRLAILVVQVKLRVARPGETKKKMLEGKSEGN